MLIQTTDQIVINSDSADFSGYNTTLIDGSYNLPGDGDEIVEEISLMRKSPLVANISVMGSYAMLLTYPGVLVGGECRSPKTRMNVALSLKSLRNYRESLSFCFCQYCKSEIVEATLHSKLSGTFTQAWLDAYEQHNRVNKKLASA